VLFTVIVVVVVVVVVAAVNVVGVNVVGVNVVGVNIVVLVCTTATVTASGGGTTLRSVSGEALARVTGTRTTHCKDARSLCGV
jgi:hypothetical protein